MLKLQYVWAASIVFFINIVQNQRITDGVCFWIIMGFPEQGKATCRLWQIRWQAAILSGRMEL